MNTKLNLHSSKKISLSKNKFFWFVLLFLVAVVVSFVITVNRYEKEADMQHATSAALETELADVRQANEALNTQLEDTLSQVEKLNIKNNELKKENTDLKGNVEELTAQLEAKRAAASATVTKTSTYKSSGTGKLTASGGVYNNPNTGYRETWYSQRVLPGEGLNIPGRHVNEQGLVCDDDGYICVAAHSNTASKGDIVETSLGTAKVYDTGCAEGTIDVYVDW